MPRQPANRFLITTLALLLAACGQGGGEPMPRDAGREELGLFTSLPIYWAEGQDIAAMLGPEAPQPGWVRDTLEQRARLVPLDTLEAEGLAPLEYLLIAQPRALSPAENVALDDWVRAGGRALVLADPFLTQHSEFALGDPRRPFDVVLISPILARWGLELRFDDQQDQTERMVTLDGTRLPVELPGSFALAGAGEDSDCSLSGEGLLARCRIGKGQVILLADAALVDTEEDSQLRREALESLLARLHAG